MSRNVQVWGAVISIEKGTMVRDCMTVRLVPMLTHWTGLAFYRKWMGVFTHYWFERGSKVFYIEKDKVVVLKTLTPKEVTPFIKNGKPRKSRALKKKEEEEE